MEKPAFEVRCGDKTYRIFASGRVEGFEGAPCMVINRIPVLIAQAKLLASFPSGRMLTAAEREA